MALFSSLNPRNFFKEEQPTVTLVQVGTAIAAVSAVGYGWLKYKGNNGICLDCVFASCLIGLNATCFGAYGHIFFKKQPTFNVSRVGMAIAAASAVGYGWLICTGYDGEYLERVIASGLFGVGIACFGAYRRNSFEEEQPTVTFVHIGYAIALASAAGYGLLKYKGYDGNFLDCAIASGLFGVGIACFAYTQRFNGYVSCATCDLLVPKDKAIERFFIRNIVDAASVGDSQEAGAHETYALPKSYTKLQYCASCAIISKIDRKPSKAGRKDRAPPPRFQRPMNAPAL